MQTLATLPSTEYLHECFHYDPVTGELRWKYRPRHHFTTTKEWKRWNARFAGTDAGYERRHCRVNIAGRTYTAHRVIWKWATGKEPPANIDHKNCDGYDNRLSNLREATQTKQNWNKGLQKNNRSGHKGVSQYRDKFRATIQANRTQRHLGIFSTAREAAAAYEAAARDLQGEFYRDA